MDNNPFRNSQPPSNNGSYSYMSSNYQSQPPQQQQLSYQQSYNTGYPTPSSGYQQQQPPSWQYQQQQQQQISNTPMMAQQTSSFSGYNPQSHMGITSSLSPTGQYTAYASNNDLMSSSSTNNPGNTQSSYGFSFSMPNQTGFPASTNQSMYMQQQYPQQQQQQQQSSSNVYIPPNFGMSNYTSPPPSQPRHPPIDASSLLKGTQIRRVECPTCQKMIEGDDMAINHHVNQHFT